MDRLELAKCPQSPTGVHWWKIAMLGINPTGVCKFCSEERQFDNSHGSDKWDYGERRKMGIRLLVEQAIHKDLK